MSSTKRAVAAAIIALDEARAARRETGRAVNAARDLRFGLSTEFAMAGDAIATLRRVTSGHKQEQDALRAALADVESAAGRQSQFGAVLLSVMGDAETRMAASIEGAKFRGVYVEDVVVDSRKHLVVVYSNGERKDLGPLGKVMYRGGGSSSAAASEAAATEFTRVDVTYVSTTDNRPSRIVYVNLDATSTEARFDWATGAAGTFQYKGTAVAGTATSAASWVVFRTTLDSSSPPRVTLRKRLAGSWDGRVALPW